MPPTTREDVIFNRALQIPGRWRLTARFTAAAGLAAAVTLTGLPGLPVDDTAAAGPAVSAKLKPGYDKRRCDVRNGLPAATRTPANSGLPNSPLGNFHKADNLPTNFEFDLPGQAYDGLTTPTPEEEAKARSQVPGDTEKNYKAWRKIADASGKPADRAMEIYARWLNTGKKKPFKQWFDKIYIRNQTNLRKGAGFEAKLVRDYKLIGPDWLCEVYVELFDAEGNKVGERRYDAYNRRTKEFNEFKSDSKPRADQLAKDRVVARSLKDHTFRYTGAKKFTAGQQASIDDFNRELERERGKPNQVRGNQRLYNPVARTTPIPGYSDHQRWFAPGCQTGGTQTMAASANSCGTRGPANQRALGSGRTLEEAKQIQAEARRLDTRGTLPRGGPGGIDFTSLELRYVGGLGKGKGMQYSMRADQMPDPDTNPGWGGEAKMQLASDAMFTWLALTPDKFWVNLNPDEPDRVMDSKFASTDAGRILLEADLRMKHDFYKAMDPKTDLGRRYWAALPKQNGNPCMPGLRNWIEPKPAQVREQDGGIYILDAPLALKSTAQETVTEGPGEPICDPNDAEIAAAQAVIDSMIVPEVEKQINTAPHYADLRRVYTSRVAAEYIRQQDAKNPTDFRSIINSDDVEAWPLRAPNQNWDKDELFRKYRKIYTEGEFTYDVDTAQGVRVYIVGGVDFSKQPKRNITRTQFNVENRDLDHTTVNSRKSDDTSYRDTDTLYLGGGKVTGSGGGDTPEPPPTQDPDPTPTDKPTDPGKPDPTPSQDPGPGDTGDKPKPPGGDLADTGSNTPVGLFAALAAALAAVGGGLVWWMRRRGISPGRRTG
ncbi:hypothetical protein [Streptomyces akebiae]|uniref:LPXTG cell wall anchor domain-containing protein n=1 Tax=Streptomyces akebiae TaxID=2865673 RepID=A0ABX8XXK9_9ACTN|nr:hypothetical protein [Streptomyces akebiae]QYX79911.1 hypothetical protein K1J60_28335 [Streptomyces akebiae]